MSDLDVDVQVASTSDVVDNGRVRDVDHDTSDREKTSNQNFAASGNEETANGVRTKGDNEEVDLESEKMKAEKKMDNIKEKVAPKVCAIEDEDDDEEQNSANGNTDPGDNIVADKVVIIEEEEEPYEVEFIRDVKISRGKKLYFIKWKNYGEEHNTWEPEVNCCGSRELIAEFENEQQKNIKKKKAERQTKDQPARPAPTKTTRLKITPKRPRIVETDSETEKETKSSDSDDSNEGLTKTKTNKASKSKASTKRKTAERSKSDSDCDEDVSKERQPPPTKKLPTLEEFHEPPDVVEDPDIEPEGIIGATYSNGELMFLIKWKNQMKADLISEKIVKYACPQTLLQYYEKSLSWQE